MEGAETTSASVIDFETERDWPLEVPTKFSREGEAQKFPGNTLICHISDSNSPLLDGLRAVHTILASDSILRSRCHLLPPSSWHMTVLEGVCETRRRPDLWPAGKMKQPLDRITAEFAERLLLVAGSLERQGLGPPYYMRAYEWDGANGIGVGLRVQGATAGEEKRLRQLRDVLADALGYRLPSHASYDFHISVSYLLAHLSQDEERKLARVLEDTLASVQVEFQLGPVEFCTFENMHLFKPIMYLE